MSNRIMNLSSRVPYSVKHAAVNNWSIPLAIADRWFDRYYLLHWDGLYLVDKVSQGTIIHDGVLYRINWITVPSECYKAKQVAVSFRRIEGNEEGYVLVRKLAEKD